MPLGNVHAFVSMLDFKEGIKEDTYDSFLKAYKTITALQIIKEKKLMK